MTEKPCDPSPGPVPAKVQEEIQEMASALPKRRNPLLRHCQYCHAADAGSGPNLDFSAEHLVSDPELLTKINASLSAKGSTRMPKDKVLSPAQKQEIEDFLRSLH